MEYVNDTMTHIYIETDVFQTWQFDFIYKQSFIEREHVNDDTVGKNTVPENVETGDYIQDDYDQLDDYHLVWIVRVLEDMTGNKSYGHNYGGIYYAGMAYMCFSYSDVINVVSEYENDQDLGIENIKDIYMIPYEFTNMHLYHDFPDGIPTQRSFTFRKSRFSRSNI